MAFKLKYFLVTYLLISLSCSFDLSNPSAFGSNIIVKDLPDPSTDFQYINDNNRLYYASFTGIQSPVLSFTHNYSDLGHLDMKNVKFYFYPDNKTVTAIIGIGDSPSHKFKTGDAYGMALNIGSFNQSSYPPLTEADFIQQFKYINDSWYEIFSVQFNDGQQIVTKAPEPVKQFSFLRTGEHYVRISFDTERIGSPDRFQVKFFSLAVVNLSSNKSYTLFDDSPWIEIPTPTLTISLDPGIIRVYDGQELVGKLNISSTSSIAQIVDLTTHPANQICNGRFKFNDYCWFFPDIANSNVKPILEPPSNSISIPFKLGIHDADPLTQNVKIVPIYSVKDSLATDQNKPVPKYYHFKVTDFLSDKFFAAMDFLNTYYGLFGFLIGTITIPAITYGRKLVGKLKTH